MIPRGHRVCATCHAVAKPKLHTKGSLLIELILWLLLIVPGLLYSLWRHNSRQKVCPECGSTELLPPQSPRAKKILAEPVE